MGAHELEGDFLVDEGVVGEVDDAHAAFADALFDHVAVRDAIAYGKRQIHVLLKVGQVGNYKRDAASETNAGPALYCGWYKDADAAIWTGNLNHRLCLNGIMPGKKPATRLW